MTPEQERDLIWYVKCIHWMVFFCAVILAAFVYVVTFVAVAKRLGL